MLNIPQPVGISQVFHDMIHFSGYYDCVMTHNISRIWLVHMFYKMSTKSKSQCTTKYAIQLKQYLQGK